MKRECRAFIVSMRDIVFASIQSITSPHIPAPQSAAVVRWGHHRFERVRPHAKALHESQRRLPSLRRATDSLTHSTAPRLRTHRRLPSRGPLPLGATIRGTAGTFPTRLFELDESLIGGAIGGAIGSAPRLSLCGAPRLSLGAQGCALTRPLGTPRNAERSNGTPSQKGRSVSSARAAICPIL